MGLDDAEPADLETAQKAYEDVFITNMAKPLLDELKSSLHYTIEPRMTCAYMISQFASETGKKQVTSILHTDLLKFFVE